MDSLARLESGLKNGPWAPSYQAVDTGGELESDSEVSEEEDQDDDGETIISPAKPFHEEHNSRDNSFGRQQAQLLKRITPETGKMGSNVNEDQSVHKFTAQSSEHRNHHHNYHQEYRMVDRDGDFHQSRGKFSVRKKIKEKTGGVCMVMMSFTQPCECSNNAYDRYLARRLFFHNRHFFHTLLLNKSRVWM